MARDHEVQYFDYVNHPYERVRAALTEDALAVFQDATHAASSRAQEVASELRINVGALEIGARIAITVKEIDEREASVTARPVTRLALAWEAARAPRLFPLMKGELSIYPLTSTETQLDFLGRYDPPLGALGDAMDALVGHRIAEASVHRFVSDIAKHLRETLA
jgi:hypothetical protein